MLMIRCDIQNEKVILSGLDTLADRFPAAVNTAFTKAAKLTAKYANHWLSGAKEPAGAYPVPVKTGWLRRMLNWLKPGETKAIDGETIVAGDMEAIVYDSAAYATTVFLGKGSSAKFGQRNAIIDAFKQFNGGDAGNKLGELLDKEITAEAKRIGLA